MAKYNLVFHDSGDNEGSELVCYLNDRGKIYIGIDEGDRPPAHITLDISTAIALVKNLKREINNSKQNG